jgi:hypothetical protein
MANDNEYGLTPARSSVPTNPYGLQAATNPYGLQDVSDPGAKYGLVSADTPQPPVHEPNDRLFSGTGQATISAYRPTVWDRITNMFRYANPNTRPRAQQSDRDDSSMQLIRPEEFLSQTEQHAHPVITGIGQVAGGITSPESVALIAGTAGLGELPGAAAMLPRLMSAGFGAQAIYQAAKTYPEIKAAIARGDVSETERLLTHAVLNVGMAALATKHAATGKGAISGKVNESPAPAIETQLTEPTSPLGEVLHEPAPDVRIVDSAAAKDHLMSENAPEAEPDRSASVRKAPDVAQMRAPTAKIVSEDHVPIVSRNEVLAEAVQTMVNNSGELAKLGIDPSKINSPADAKVMLQQAADHIQSNLDPRASSTLTFEMQKQLASELGMSVEDLLSRKSGQAFNAEQAIAARALLNDSGLNVVKAAQSAVADNSAMPDLTRSLAQHQAILDAVKGMTSEAGRALGSFNVKDLPASKIADAMSKLPEDAQAKAAQLLSKIDPNNPRQLNDFIEKITPSSTADKIFEFFRNSLLSGPATVIRKGVSEATMMALETTKKLVAAGLSKAKGEDAPQRFFSEAYWYARGAIHALQHSKAVLTGEFDLADAPEFERTGQQAIKGTVGDVVRFPSTILSRQTNLMYVLNYFGELNSQAARTAISEGLEGTELAARQEYLVEHPTAEMTKAANQTALHNTFQTELSKFGKKVQSTIQADPTGIAKYLLPFFKTPVNLVKEAGNYSPYGLLKGLAKGDLDAQARGIVGSSIAAGVAYLAANGLVTGGGPIDTKKRQTLESTGWQPYSVKIGDRYISYRKAEPVGLTLALVADAVHGMKLGDSAEVTNSKADTALAHIARNLQDVAFLPTLSNLTEAITNPEARAKNFISRQVASFVPALVKDAAQATDRTVRKPDGITETLESRIPGLTSRVPAAVDIAGKTVQRPASAVGGANPFPISESKNDLVLSELARLGVATSQPPASIKWRGKQTQLLDSERQQLAEQEGQELHSRLSQIVGTTGWQRLSDDAKRKRVSEIRRVIEQGRPQRIGKLLNSTQASLNRGSL